MGALSQLSQLALGFSSVSAANTGLAAYGQIQSGQQEKAAYNYDAAVTLEQMQQKMQTTEARYSNLIGRQASAYARAGVDIASGSPLLVMAHTAAEGATEQESEREAGTEQAALERYYGKVAAFKGTVGGISTFLAGLQKFGTTAAGIMGPQGAVPTVPTSMYDSM